MEQAAVSPLCTGILEAIRYHTTGAPDMGLLSRIVFVADMIEETRDYPELRYLQKTVQADFENGFAEALRRQYDFLCRTKEPEEIDPHTRDAYEFYCK